MLCTSDLHKLLDVCAELGYAGELLVQFANNGRDVALAVETSVQGRITNNGQTCVAAKRFIVVDAVYDRFRDAYVEAMGAVEMGDPMSEECGLGPMSNEGLRDELVSRLRHADGWTRTSGRRHHPVSPV